MTIPVGAISLRNVGKRYRLFTSVAERLKERFTPFGHHYHRECWALRGVNLDISPGETLGILGRNGSGKSTLLQVIASILRPTEGTVEVRGAVSALLELGTGFNPELTGAQNAVLYLTLAGLSRRDAAGAMAEVIRFADIGEYIDQPMRTYSTGMFMRLAFAAAVSVDPDILIVDEALAVGDAQFQHKCFSRLEQFKNAGKTIILVTHDPQVLPRHCTRGLVLEHGALVCDTTPTDAVSRYYEVLYHVASPSRLAAAELASSTATPADQLVGSLFALGTLADGVRSRPNYNPGEVRFGNRQGEILDVVTVVEGRGEVTRIASGERVDVYVRVVFRVPVEQPTYGLFIKSVDGLMIYGTNTWMQRLKTAPVTAGQEVVVRFSCPMTLVGGDVFLDVGLGEFVDDQYVAFDGRCSVLQVTIDQTRWCHGTSDIGAEYSEVYRAPLDAGSGRDAL